MIYTCTLNPAIDMFVEVDALEPYVVNRSNIEDYQPNGKAVNISIMLKQMNIHSTALGFLGGFTGEFIDTALQKMGITTDFVQVDGITRVNTFVRSGEKEYKIVNKGPAIPAEKSREILQQIEAIPAGSYLFVSGSTPRGIDETIYRDIAQIAYENKVHLILDVSSKVLLDCLQYEPYLIKPNHEELADFFDKESVTEAEMKQLGAKLLSMGSQHVLISKGEKGAVFLSQDMVIEVTSPKGKVVNTACAGDALLAAFVGKWIAGSEIQEALAYASAVGASTAFTARLSDLSDVASLLTQIEVITTNKE